MLLLRKTDNGEILGATVGPAALAIAAGAGVVISAPVAGAVILGAALIGGIFAWHKKK